MAHKLCSNVLKLEQNMFRIERLLWYVSGVISIKFGSELVPVVSALVK